MKAGEDRVERSLTLKHIKSEVKRRVKKTFQMKGSSRSKERGLKRLFRLHRPVCDSLDRNVSTGAAGGAGGRPVG